MCLYFVLKSDFLHVGQNEMDYLDAEKARTSKVGVVLILTHAGYKSTCRA